MASNMSEYERKLLEMRLNLQENQAYMQDAFEDIGKWTGEMKEKEKKLTEDPNSVKTSLKGLPPIRNLVTKKKKKKRTNKKEPQTTETGQKLKGYDYRAWDKLDIDKMCEEVDNQKTSSSEYTTDEEWEQEQRLTRAEWEKERGNQFYKDNMIDDAIECYTKAINLNPNNAIYVANRAMCYLKQNRYAQAEVDCSLSIALDPNYPKAYHRRASARLSLGKLDDARKDFEALLRLEPMNKIAQIEINKIDNSIEKNNLVFPVVKSEAERSKKPLVRVKIEDINVEETSTERVKIRQDLTSIQQKIKLTGREEQLFNPNTPDKHVNKQVSVGYTQQETTNPTITKNPPKSIPECPKNGYQFKKDWQYLSDNLENLAAYFKKIPPGEYPKLFLNGLESDNLAKILEIFNKFYKNDTSVDLYASLKSLSQVKRFQTQLMFLTQQDKNNLTDILNHLKASSKCDISELETMLN